MDRILARYMTENIRTTQAFLDMIADVAGKNEAAWFREQLAVR